MLALALLVHAPARAGDLIVATDTSFEPFEFKQGNAYVGFDIDLWDAIARDIGVTYRIQPMDFNGIIPALQTGQVDVGLSGMTIKEVRRRVIDFSDGYYDSGFQLMVPIGSTITGPYDLAGKIIAIKSGTSAADYAKAHFKGATLRAFPNIDNAFLAVATGNADAAMHDTPNILYYLRTNGAGRMKVVGRPMMAQQYGFAFPKGSSLTKRVNASLARLRARGDYDRIYLKWFGTLPPKADPAARGHVTAAAVATTGVPRFDWSVIGAAMPELLRGARLTVFIALAGLAGGLVIGLVAGLMRAYGSKFVNAVAMVYVELIRGTPIIVQVMFIYFALPLMLKVRIDPLAAAVAAIVINAGAYIAEIVRGAFLSVQKGLREAGLALGLPFWKVLLHVVGPLALRRMIPGLGNQFIVSLKDTSLFIVIGVGELTRQGQEIMAANFRAVEIWTAVAFLYLVMTGVLTLCLRLVEKRMRIL
ncbi:glutamine ABC transporter permease GlnP [Nguyenibacter sp. L1]|nr:glutamine ABC transporter permease GlnP [Nguyenibacter sp. L1]WRH87570.1 glutamine ABC transporter permease GlnP [Nguyenibacter sp. L1]